jgi:predicted secreted protein
MLDFENMTEEEQIEFVRQSPDSIGYFQYPCEESQLITIRADPYGIDNIRYPTEKVQLESVRKQPLSIAYIKNPTEETQLEAVRNFKYSNSQYRYSIYINLTSEKAKELYRKLEKAHGIIK